MVSMSDDGLPRIVDLEGTGDGVIGRALTEQDGDEIVELLNRLSARQSQELRDRILSEVADAVENCFEETA